MRLYWRALRLAEHIISGAMITGVLFIALRLGMDSRRTPAVAQWWQRRACRILHLRIQCFGQAAKGPALVVANHVSWLDIPVLGGLLPVAFLSKAEVRDWPLFGRMAQLAGTLFIERGNHQSSAIAQAIHERVERGCKVLFFPEGTTSDGREVRRFHPRLFAAAQREGALIQPVSIRYPPNEEGRSIAPFIDDDTFPAHLLRMLKEPQIEVEVRFATPIEQAAAERKALAEATRQAIRQSLGLSEPDGTLKARARS